MDSAIRALLSEVIRPIIEADGGTIELVQTEGRRITIEMGGACSGCPGLHYTRTRVIEPSIRETLGNDVEVELRRAKPSSG
ncbi:MAG: NifU family protein [Myxococcota bacterium]